MREPTLALDPRGGDAVSEAYLAASLANGSGPWPTTRTPRCSSAGSTSTGADRGRSATTSAAGTSPTTPASRWCWTGGPPCPGVLPGQRRDHRRASQIRRRFGFAARRADQLRGRAPLDRGEEPGTSSRILTAEIERPRVGPMRDIVATIQPEQDELVRADSTRRICVQGAPGTGKTAVGLHRAAYLLYLHRERLRRAGVLVVGPNRAFLHYISAVLPALGEVEVQQATVDDLVRPGRRCAPTSRPRSQTLKHDPRMAEVLRRALCAGLVEPTEPIDACRDGSYRWRIAADALRRIVDEVRAARAAVRGRPGAWCAQRWRRAAARQTEAGRRLARTTGVQDAMARSRRRCASSSTRCGRPSTPERWSSGCSPTPTRWRARPTGVLDRGRAGAAAAGPSRRAAPKAAQWTRPTLVLIDEAAGLIEREPSFGHVVVDEAQDLSPMQCGRSPGAARRLDHPARRPGPGHRAVGRRRLGGDARGTSASRTRASWCCAAASGCRTPWSTLANRLLPHWRWASPRRVAAPRRRPRPSAAVDLLAAVARRR